MERHEHVRRNIVGLVILVDRHGSARSRLHLLQALPRLGKGGFGGVEIVGELNRLLLPNARRIGAGHQSLEGFVFLLVLVCREFGPRLIPLARQPLHLARLIDGAGGIERLDLTTLADILSRVALIFDREDANVVVSTENVDDFEKNLVSIRCEERLALAVKRPEAFVTGPFTSAVGG